MSAPRRTALALFPLLALTACGGGGSSTDVAGNGTVAAAGPATAQTAEVDGKDTLKFAPNVVTAHVCTQVNTVKNDCAVRQGRHLHLPVHLPRAHDGQGHRLLSA